MRPVGLLAALVGGALVMPTASAGAAPRALAGFSAHDFEVRPAAISYTGDGTGYHGGSEGSGPRDNDYGHLTWVSWGRRTAYATGVDWLNDCDPYCAAGTFSAVAATVRLGTVRHNRYTHMTIRCGVADRPIRHRCPGLRLGTGKAEASWGCSQLTAIYAANCEHRRFWDAE